MRQGLFFCFIGCSYETKRSASRVQVLKLSAIDGNCPPSKGGLFVGNKKNEMNLWLNTIERGRGELL